jgi:hypothetical protein
MIMRNLSLTRRFLAVGAVITWLALVTVRPVQPIQVANAIPMAPSMRGRLPIQFEPNQGQVDPTARFLARGRDYSLILTPAEAIVTLAPAYDDAHTKSSRS